MYLRLSALIVLLLLCGVSIAQPPIGRYPQINQGMNIQRGYFRALHIPAGCGAPALKPDQWTGSGAFYLDSCSNITYIYSLGVWRTVGRTNTSLGSGYPLAVTGTNDVKSIVEGRLIKFDSATTGQIEIIGREQIDVFLIGGQSNAVGNSGGGGAAASPNPDSGTVYQYFSSAFSMVTNEVGNPSTGSAWPSFGITWYNKTGRKIAFVPTAVNGTGQLQESDSGFGNWSPTGTLWQNSVDKVQEAMEVIRDAGYEPIFRGVLWVQGENDANFIYAGTETKAEYKTGLTNMIADYRTEFGSNMPFYIFRTGVRTPSATYDAAYIQVREAQQEVALADNLKTKIVFYNALEFPTRGLQVDQYHYSQTGLNEMGQIGAENISNVTNLLWQRQGESEIFTMNNVGIGIENPAHLLDINAGTSSTRAVRIRQNAEMAGHIYIENTHASVNAASGFRLFNDGGLNGQILLGSQAYTANPNGLIIHSFVGAARFGSNSGSAELFTGVAGPVNSNVRLRVINSGRVGIGANPVPDTSAILDLQSTTLGFLTPRMNTTQMNAIVVPANGLLIYNTDSLKFIYYNGAVWSSLGAGGSGGGSGTVTNVATGLGLSGGPITTTGTIIADTSYLVTKSTAQVISGAKNFTAAPTFSTLTSGRFILAGTGGLASDDAAFSGNGATNKFTIEGTQSSLTDYPGLFLKFTSDANPVFAYHAYAHDNVALVFDGWFNGSAWISSHSGGNFSIHKTSSELAFGVNTGTTAGSSFGAFDLNVGFHQSVNGNVGIGTALGTTNALSKFNVLSTTTQERLMYSTSQYMTTTVGSAAGVTFDATGTTPLFTFNDRVGIVTGSATPKVGGNLVSNVTTVGNVGTGEDNLMTYTIPAGTLSQDGDRIEFEMSFSVAANSTLKVHYGATSLFTFSALATEAVYRVIGSIYRTGAATQRATFQISGGLGTTQVGYQLPTETLSGTVVLKATGEGTSNNDITQTTMGVKFFPAN